MVSWEHVLQPSELEGQSCHIHSCFTSARNLCRVLLKREDEVLEKRQESWHSLLTSWCDSLGKEKCNSCRIVILVESPFLIDDVANVRRDYWLLVRATFQPKFQLYVSSDRVDEKKHFLEAEEEDYPFTLRLHEGRSLVCPEKKIGACMTSDEVALVAARLGSISTSRCWTVQYSMPPEKHLLTMEVHGKTRIEMSKKTTKAQMKNPDLDELKKMMGGNGDMNRDTSQLSQVLPCMVAIVKPWCFLEGSIRNICFSIRVRVNQNFNSPMPRTY